MLQDMLTETLQGKYASINFIIFYQNIPRISEQRDGRSPDY